MATEANDSFDEMEQLMRKPNASQEELVRFYSAWSKNYDKDVLNHNYTGPSAAAEQLAQKLEEFGYSRDARILDLGCGTGLVGEELHKRGYKNIDGIDLSLSLLEIAKTKGIYTSLQQGIMGSEQCKDLGVAAKQYDAAICVGVFTFNHVKSEGLNDIIHVVKPGGLVNFGIRESVINDSQNGFHEKMDQLSEEGKWKLLIKHYHPTYLKDDGCWFFVCQIL